MKLEVGKRYVARNGDVTEPLRLKGGDELDHPYAGKVGDAFASWTEDGAWFYDMKNEEELDLVAEFVEPVLTLTPQPQADLAWKLRTWAEENYMQGEHLSLHAQDVNDTIQGVLKAVLGERLDYSASFKKV